MLAQPNRYFLTDFMIWVTLKCITKIGNDIKSQNALEQCGSAITGVFYPATVGAVGSSIALISYGAIAAYILVFTAIYSKNLSRGKKALWAIFGLTAFTLVVEPFIAIFLSISSGDICGVAVDYVFNKLGLPIIEFFNIVSLAVRFFSKIALIKEISTITESSEAEGSISGVAQNPKNLIISLALSFLSFGTGGYIYLGQVKKGIIMIILMIFLSKFSVHSSLFQCIYILGIVDTYRLTRRNNRFDDLGNWGTCLNFYTLVWASFGL